MLTLVYVWVRVEGAIPHQVCNRCKEHVAGLEDRALSPYPTVVMVTTHLEAVILEETILQNWEYRWP